MLTSGRLDRLHQFLLECTLFVSGHIFFEQSASMDYLFSFIDIYATHFSSHIKFILLNQSAHISYVELANILIDLGVESYEVFFDFRYMSGYIDFTLCLAAHGQSQINSAI